LEFEEHVPKTKKVRDFLFGGIMDICLQVGKDSPWYPIVSSGLQRMPAVPEYSHEQQSKNDHHVGSAGWHGCKRDKSDDDNRPSSKKHKTGKFEKKHNKFNKNKHKPKKPLTAGSYSNGGR
jgi:hypothetical protein